MGFFDVTVPKDPTQLGDWVGWEAWTATGAGPPYVTWERRSSRTHGLKDIPLTKFLGMRVYYATKWDGMHAYSDMVLGTNYCALQVKSKTIRVVGADMRTEMDAATSTGRWLKLEGALMEDPAWNALEAELSGKSRAAGW